MHIASIGIDLGKTTFHLVALGERSKVLVRKKFSRAQLLAYTANLPSSLIGLEACAGAHFLGAALRQQGHEVRLIPGQFIKPYRKSNKNDFIDGEAICGKPSDVRNVIWGFFISNPPVRPSIPHPSPGPLSFP
jgi:transposase